MGIKPPIKKGQVQRGLGSAKSKAHDILSIVEDDLANKGVVPFENDDMLDEYLQLPADLTEATSQDLGRYLNTFTKQKMYIRTLIGRTGAIYRELDEELNKIRDLVYSELPAKVSVKEKELKLRSHPEYGDDAVQLLKDVAIYSEKLNMLNLYISSIEDGIFNISREVSRRESDWNSESREHNISNKKRGK